MPLSDYHPIAARFIARAATRLRAGSGVGDRWRLARQYRGMSDHCLADIGYSRTQIEFHVLGDHDRR